jgi:NADH-quinone oxidoreductase subunit E
MTDKSHSLLPADIREHIDRWVLRYPPEQKRSGVFEALRVVQERQGGSLTTEWMDAVADYLEMPRIAVYEIGTFYSLYYLEPVGRHVIDVCTNISCMLKDSASIMAHFKKRLGIDVGETTPDGQFTLNEVECLGACAAAPMCQIGKKYYEYLTPDKIDEIVGALTHGK